MPFGFVLFEDNSKLSPRLFNVLRNLCPELVEEHEDARSTVLRSPKGKGGRLQAI